MKLTFISDTHNKHQSIGVSDNGGDIIFHSGDATGHGSEWEIVKFLKWYSELNYKHKVFIPGNHDFGFEKEPSKYRKMFADAGVHLLIDEGVTLEGINIWGSPVTPWFHNWAFNRARNGAEASLHNVDFIFPHWDMIPQDTDILITHGPPYMILDELQYVDGTPKGQFVGCEDLLARIKEVGPKIHAFGHIHCGYGTKKVDDTLFINASCLDETYSPGNEPINVEFVDGEVESHDIVNKETH